MSPPHNEEMELMAPMRHGLERTLACALFAAGFAIAAACARPPRTGLASEGAYTPGLGEIMSATQMRHLKLWYAGRAGNWRLASYEVDELEEGFADAVRFHPEHKHSPRPLTELVPQFTDGPIAALRAAIAKQNQEEFRSAHDALTQGCNGCHVATEFSFNVVKRPVGNPYMNQTFETPR